MPHLVETNMAAWKYVPGEKPKCFSTNIWNPCEYPPETIWTIGIALRKMQQLGEKCIQGKIDRKELIHEDRKLVGYDVLSSKLFASLGIPSDKDSIADMEGLRLKARQQQEKIQQRTASIGEQLGLSSNTELSKVAQVFLHLQKPHWSSGLVAKEKKWEEEASFQRAIFTAERERLWPDDVLFLGRQIAQLIIAKEIVDDILLHDAHHVRALTKKFGELKSHYLQTDRFPRGLVHHDAHPGQFHVYNGHLSILDVDGLSYDVCFADISNDYVFKIVRAYFHKNISKERAIQLLNAALIPDWVQDHGIHLLSYNIASFWNEGMTLIDYYDLNHEAAKRINLAVTLKKFFGSGI